MNRALLATAGLVLAGGAAIIVWQNSARNGPAVPRVDAMMHGAGSDAPARPADQIAVPKLSAPAQMGLAAFTDKCATCHGANAAGTDRGPPLVHKIYEPSHHADFAFVRAVRGGAQSHHWRFGDMEPVDGVTDRQVEWITRYVRELQRANGIN